MIEVRFATEKDLPQILEIYNDVIANTAAVFQYNLHNLQSRIDWFNQKKEEGFPVFVAEENDKIVGYSTFGQFRNWQAYKYSVENSVYVKKEARGKGISKLLMQPLIDATKELKLHTIVAGIVADNEASIQLHKKFGFVEVAYFKEVGYKFNKWLDLVFMQLILMIE